MKIGLNSIKKLIKINFKFTVRNGKTLLQDQLFCLLRGYLCKIFVRGFQAKVNRLKSEGILLDLNISNIFP